MAFYRAINSLCQRRCNTLQKSRYTSSHWVLDPYWITFHDRHIWHRGFPWEWITERNKATGLLGYYNHTKILVQAGLIDGEPDIDAVCRIGFGGKCAAKSKLCEPFTTCHFPPGTSKWNKIGEGNRSMIWQQS